MKFTDLGLTEELLKGINDIGFEDATPIQEEVIPMFFKSDKDIIGLAQTGTGKTAAYGLPIIDSIDPTNKDVQALILSPTRELCIQITEDLKEYSKYKENINVVPVYGGAGIEKQIRDVSKKAHIVVATPGRMIDLLGRKSVFVDTIKYLVLDEADEMLNIGFREALDEILETTPAEKRTLLFSATMEKSVEKIANKYMNTPIRITIGKQNAGAENVSHIFYKVHARDRYLALKRVADYNPDIYGIVFCRTRAETKDVADKLIKDGYNADAIHGDLTQAQRDLVMKRFRDRALQMLIATDVAARGIDVSDITHVINYNLPEANEIYTHRSGRTGRADKKGISISITNYREQGRIKEIEKIIGQKFEHQKVPSGKQICNVQLLSLVDKMANVDVDEKQIEPFMDKVYGKLSLMDKEEIIKRFLSIEFNRFLDYYKNTPDLDEDTKSSPDRKGRSKRGGKYDRLFINLGKKDDITVNKLIGVINRNTGDREISIGGIDIKDSFSFFEIPEDFSQKVIDSLSDKDYKDRPLRIERAEKPKQKSGGGRGGSGKGGSGRSSNRGGSDKGGRGRKKKRY